MFDVLDIFFYNKKVYFSWGQLCWTQQLISLQPISGPCSMEKSISCEWRITIPASLMRVEKHENKQKAHWNNVYLRLKTSLGHHISSSSAAVSHIASQWIDLLLSILLVSLLANDKTSGSRCNDVIQIPIMVSMSRRNLHL